MARRITPYRELFGVFLFQPMLRFSRVPFTSAAMAMLSGISLHSCRLTADELLQLTAKHKSKISHSKVTSYT
jgi:hypothetical protein